MTLAGQISAIAQHCNDLIVSATCLIFFNNRRHNRNQRHMLTAR